MELTNRGGVYYLNPYRRVYSKDLDIYIDIYLSLYLSTKLM